MALFAIRGPLFFGAAEKALSTMRRFTPGLNVVIIDFNAVPILDMTAISVLQNLLDEYHKQGIGIIFMGVSGRLRRKMRRAGIRMKKDRLSFASTAYQAKNRAEQWLDKISRLQTQENATTN